MKYTNQELCKMTGSASLNEIDEKEYQRRNVFRQIDTLLADKRLLEVQRQVLMAYRDDYIARGNIKPFSIYCIIQTLSDFGIHCKKPFIEVTKRDINAYTRYLRYEKPITTGKRAKLGVKGCNERSMISKNVYLKYFYKWLYDEEGIEYKETHPDLVYHLVTIVKDRGVIHLEDLPTYDEIKKMVNRADNFRDKCILMMLYDMGCRIGELYYLDINNLKIHDKYAEVRIKDGKTGARTNVITISAPFLKHYLNVHPFKDNENSPLFINLNDAQYGRRLMGQGISDMIKRCAKRAGITKNMHAHLFRHARATDRARIGWNETMLRKQFGWSPTSTTPSIYIHLVEEDLKNIVLKEHGLHNPNDEDLEKARVDSMKPIECPVCYHNNPWDALTCQCGLVLNPLGTEEGEKLFEQELANLGVTTDLVSKEDMSEITKRMLKTFSSEQDDWFLQQMHHNLDKRKPTYKYKEKAIELREKGLSYEKIANELGISYNSARSLALEVK